MNPSSTTVPVLIASYLEAEHIARIRQVDPRLEVIFEPELLAQPAYPADHYGVAARSPAQEARWRALLGRAEVLFDFDYSHKTDLAALAPQLKWVQASSAGIGQFVKRYGYDLSLPRTIFTTASGIHARPLAEFCVMALMMHYKNILPMLQAQREHRWERFAGTDLEGKTLAIIGLGRIGTEVACLAAGLGMRVIGTNAVDPGPCVATFYPLDALPQMLAQADAVVLAVPHTPATEGMIAQAQFEQMKRGAYLVNIARGAVVDEAALLAALRSGQLSGAALDVFATEPLPPSSPLWDLPNVLVSPHSASTSDRENARLTELFCDNLRRYLAGEPLRNVLDPERYY